MPGRDHFFLLGPRGTGKTLWSTHHYPKALRIDLLDPETLRLLSARPERLTELVEGNRDKPQVIIDEVQKLPALLEVVHLLIERKTGQQFILTGSSARKLRRQGVNLLGGRAAQKHLHPYLAAQLGKRFSLVNAREEMTLLCSFRIDPPPHEQKRAGYWDLVRRPPFGLSGRATAPGKRPVRRFSFMR